MTAARTTSLAAAALTLTLAAAAQAEPDPAFARSLMKDRDTFRAITVYKELVFRETDPAKKALYTYEIGKAYRLARRWELSNEVLVRLLASSPQDPSLQPRIRLQLALDYVGMGIPGQAVSYLQEAAQQGECGRANLILGMIALDAGQTGTASAHFANAARAQAPEVAQAGTILQRASLEVDNLPYRSPALAAVMSAALPGAGQAYTGHWVDGLQAFGFVGAFGLSSFVAYRYEHDHEGPYIFTPIMIGITTLFYIANVFGAERTARYFNQRGRERFLAPLRQQVFALEF